MQVYSHIMHKYTFLAVFLFRLRAYCPLCRQIKRFKRVLLFGCVVIPPLRLKSFCVRTHRAKSGYLPAEYILPTFLARTPPPPFAQVDGGGSYREKFFIFFQIVVLCSFDYDLDLLHVVVNYGFDIISRFRISDSILRLVF